jgi:hypothetical protein
MRRPDGKRDVSNAPRRPNRTCEAGKAEPHESGRARQTRRERYDRGVRASTAVTRSVADLKRDLLFFDQIIVLGLDEMLEGDRRFPQLDEATRADCEYLVEQGVLRAGPAFRRDLAMGVWQRMRGAFGDEEAEEPPDDWGESLSNLRPAQRAALLGSTAQHPAGRIPFTLPMPTGSEFVIAYAERLFAPEIGVVPILPQQMSAADWRAIEGTFIGPARDDSGHSGGVAQVALSHVPMPGDDVPLADILAFTREDETRRQVSSLRLWIARTAFETRSSDDVSLELASMLHDFTQHMNLADMRAKDSMLQLLVGIPLEIAQELLHLRPKAAVDALFSVKARKADRLEAELSAPGHEVAFLRSAARRFPSH